MPVRCALTHPQKITGTDPAPQTPDQKDQKVDHPSDQVSHMGAGQHIEERTRRIAGILKFIVQRGLPLSVGGLIKFPVFLDQRLTPIRKRMILPVFPFDLVNVCGQVIAFFDQFGIPFELGDHKSDPQDCGP